MASAAVFVVSVLATLLCVIVAYLYLRLRSMKAPLEQQQHQGNTKDPGVPVKDPLSVTADEGDDCSDDMKRREPDTAKSDEKSSLSEGKKTGRWPVDEQSSNIPCDAKTTSKIISTDKVRDAMDYCGHIQREIKKTKHRLAVEKIEAEMTKEEKMEERLAQKRQLEEIFKLMQNHKDEFGMSSVDEIQEQVKLYMNM